MDVKVPDIGDFTDVPVVTVLVSVGDKVEGRRPADRAGKRQGDDGGAVARRRQDHRDQRQGRRHRLRGHRDHGDGRRGRRRPGAPKDGEASGTRPSPTPEKKAAGQPRSDGGKGDVHAELVVLGSGPGGYTAAFRAADLGLNVVLIERYPIAGRRLPQRRLHPVQGVVARRQGHHRGRRDGRPRRQVRQAEDRPRRAARLEERRGRAADRRPRRARQGPQGQDDPGLRPLHRPEHDRGRRPTADARTSASTNASSRRGPSRCNLPFVPHDDPRVIDSTGALELADIPKRLLVLGGGIIGLEMACVYDALGSEGHGRRADGPDHPGRRQGHRQTAARSASRGGTRTSCSRPR